MSVQFFVGGIAWAVRDAELADHFKQFGEVESAKIVMERDPQTGRMSNRSKGFGFVTMNIEEAQADSVIEKSMGNEIMGRPISVRLATPSTREERPAREERPSYSEPASE